jgi:hypothetical protein
MGQTSEYCHSISFIVPANMAFVKSITEFDEIFLQIREQHLQFLRLRDIMNATNKFHFGGLS